MMVALPDIAHHALTVAGAMRHQDNHWQSRYPVRLKGAVSLPGMVERSAGH
jgi:hypothetical protein